MNEKPDIKDVWKQFGKWFSQKNLLQKAVWIIYFIILIYEFFYTRTRYQLFGVFLLTTPTVFLFDFLFGKFKK